MSQYHLRWGGLASLVYVILCAIAPAKVHADVPLTRANVDTYRNRVELLLRGGPTRPVRPSDWLSVGDAIRTAQSSQIDLRFNEGSFARVGELTTFGFMPNTRTFRLASGTALFLIPPGNGNSVVETPSVVADIQEAAVVVRHFPEAPASPITAPPDVFGDFETDRGRTAVMVLTESTSGPVTVRLRDGRAVSLSAGQMAIVDNGNLYMFEFDLALFYQTSPLTRGLLDTPDSADTNSAIAPVRQELREDLNNQQDFVGDYLLNPVFLGPDSNITAEGGWLYPAGSSSVLTEEEAEAAAEEEAPTALPHDDSDTSIELVPPDASLDPIEDAQPPPQEDDGSSGNVVPPGVIAPPGNEGRPPTEPRDVPDRPGESSPN